MKTHWFVVVLALCATVAEMRGQFVPRLISYQGVYADTLGVPKPDGNYTFTFSLYQLPNASTAIWTETKTLAVKKGLFSTNLGDATFLITPTFDTPYWLGIQVAPDPEFTPRVLLTAAPYSLRALRADSAEYASGATLTLPYAGTSNTVAPTLTLTNTGQGSTAAFVGTSVLLPALAARSDSTGPAIGGVNLAGGNAVYGLAASTGAAVYGASTGSGNAIHGLMTGTGKAGYFRVTNNAAGDTAVYIETNGTGPALVVTKEASGSSGILIDNHGGGPGLRAFSPDGGDAVSGSTSGSGVAISGVSTGTARAASFEIDNPQNNKAGVFTSTNGTGDAVVARTTGTGRAGSFETDNPSNTISTLQTTTNGSGRALLATTTGTGSAARFEINNPSSTAAVITVNTTGSGIAADFNGKVVLDELQINGGSDLAEPFEFSPGVDTPEPGTVMVIDAEHPGRLTTSTRAYDRKVAGIVSGAHGVKPGLTLQQEGVLEGSAMVAIGGRVYCRAEARSAPIEPGDLLTTSDMEGHAMRVADEPRSHGAVIGKAMTGLKEGVGYVLVLVNLQ